MRVLVTGSTGFVGRTLLSMLSAHEVRAALRSKSTVDGATAREVGEINAFTRWDEALAGVDCVIHLAARVHVMRPGIEDERLFRETNVDGTIHLARSAARAGIKRFIFLSSIKVNGEVTTDAPFTAANIPLPLDPYGVSKYEAERHLLALAQETGMEVVIIRPPLVYGPGVKANFLRLLSLVKSGIPLPFGAIRNARSLVSVWNLCDLIRHAIDARLEVSRIFLVSDGHDVSSAELIRSIASAMRRPPRLLPVPPHMLTLLGRLTGRSAQVSRLIGSLQVDISATKNALGWQPQVTFDEGIRRTVAWFNTRPDSK